MPIIIIHNSLIGVLVKMLLFFNCYYACAFVLLSSAGGGATTLDVNLFHTLDTTLVYRLESTTLLNEHNGNQNDVGFKMTGDVHVQTIWQQADEKLLRIKLVRPELHVRSRKDRHMFDKHGSRFEGMTNGDVYVFWRHGKVHKVFISKREDVSMANFKKGIVSMLQFQLIDQEGIMETDASGRCHVSYVSTSVNSVRKTKTNCQSDDLFLVRNPKPLLDTIVTSTSVTDYHLADTHLQSVSLSETHTMTLAANSEVGNQITVLQTLTFKETAQSGAAADSDILKECHNFNDIQLKLMTAVNTDLKVESLLSEMVPEQVVDKHGKRITFVDSINANRDNFKVFGTLPSAKAFVKCVNVARTATKDDIVKALKAKNNKNIMPQLYDIMGYTQTSESHAAVSKFLHFDNVKMSDLAERYLWSLSFAAQPNPDIIIDLLHKFKHTQNIPEKVSETMLSTLASMTRNLNALHTGHDGKIYNEVQETISNYLDAAVGDSRIPYLRALVNLQSPTTLPLLLKLTRSKDTKENVLAWKAIRLILTSPSKLTTPYAPKIQKQALRTFLELDRREDSSARTHAVDILLESPENKTFTAILDFLKVHKNDSEVKQYILERLRMWQFDGVLTTDSMLHNYHMLARHGLSVAMSRRVYNGGAASNGTLSTVQEIQHGFVKRGLVSVTMDQNDISQEIFGLGIFSAGMDSLMSSGNSDGDDSSTIASAGMELSILGTHLRPFVFFTGQGELMGHVWSGTGSERTTAFQALAMLHDHQQFIRLGNGFIIDIDVKSAASFDLAGQITISLWYRNADSIVEKSAGIVILGILKLDTSFIRSTVDFALTLEPRLELSANVDFSSNVNLCMRLKQPTIVYKHNVYKVERIPTGSGSTHKLRQSVVRTVPVAGKTYALNRKNSEMCNAIFS